MRPHCTVSLPRRMPCCFNQSIALVDVVSTQIVKAAGLNVIAHRRLPFRQPAAVSERLDKLLDGYPAFRRDIHTKKFTRMGQA